MCKTKFIGGQRGSALKSTSLHSRITMKLNEYWYKYAKKAGPFPPPAFLDVFFQGFRQILT
jgi:hypothetical protein